MDFFEQLNEHMGSLNPNERKLFEFTVRNMGEVSHMSIREFANSTYVSTTTVLRFVRKLGFDGYRDFIISLRSSSNGEEGTESRLPRVLWKKTYSHEYLKNIVETVRVISQGSIDEFVNSIGPTTRIWCMGMGLDEEVARYAAHMFGSIGVATSRPYRDYERKAAVSQFAEGDIALLFSRSGEDDSVIEFAEQIASRLNPPIATVTQSANNTLQSIGNIDFYVFGEDISVGGEDLSSRASMMVIVDLLSYGLIRRISGETAEASSDNKEL